jgi:18S rRNA (adenine1779-N6/adenine1780-N6)-dimethyltransferase
MPKAPKGKRNGAANGGPYSHAGKSSAAHNIFKMKTDIGQHVLKNPGVAQAIVDKADLKQSDVCQSTSLGAFSRLMVFR